MGNWLRGTVKADLHRVPVDFEDAKNMIEELKAELNERPEAVAICANRDIPFSDGFRINHYLSDVVFEIEISMRDETYRFSSVKMITGR